MTRLERAKWDKTGVDHDRDRAVQFLCYVNSIFSIGMGQGIGIKIHILFFILKLRIRWETAV